MRPTSNSSVPPSYSLAMSMGSFTTYSSCSPLVMPTSRSRTTASDTLYLHRRLRGPGVQLARDYHAAVLPQAALPQRRLSPPGEPRIAVRLSSFSQISCSYGFHEEIIRKYGSSNAWKTFNETFDFLPLAALVDSNLPHSFR